MVLVVLVAGCGDRKSRNESDEADPEVTLAIAQSREHFEQAGGFRLEYRLEAEGSPFTIHGEGAFAPGNVVYGRVAYEGVDPSLLDVTEVLFLPPDLYFHATDGTWAVMSPWYQGIGPEEQTDYYVDRPILDYAQFTRDLRDVARDEEGAADAGLTAYAAQINVEDLQGLAPAGKIGVTRADVELSLDAATGLPRKIVIRLGGRDGGTATIEYSAYGETVAQPERPAGATPVRDLQLPQADCTGDAFRGCLEAQAGIGGVSSCEGGERRLCLAPMGRVSPELIAHLAAYYRETYSLDVRVMPAAPVPSEYADPLRDQIDAGGLLEYLGQLSPGAYNDSRATMIAVTALDIFDPESHFRYVLSVKRTPEFPQGIVSTFRMNPATYGEPPDDELFYSRVRKMVTKYVGYMYFALPLSEDPTSPMYDSIGGPGALDVMTEPLPAQ
jgi:predicted Zn-dependent protease